MKPCGVVAIVASGAVLTACGSGPKTMGDKAPRFRISDSLAKFAVGRWEQAMDYSTARTDVGKKSAFLNDQMHYQLEFCEDGTAKAMFSGLGKSQESAGKWWVEGDEIEMDFFRTVPADLPSGRPNGREQLRKMTEDLFASFGPLELDLDARRLRSARVATREDGTTFMSTPVWRRLTED